MQTEDIQLSTADGPMRVYRTTPGGESRGAVIVVPEAFGVNEHIEDVTRRVADAGYVGIGLDIFHRAGGGTAAYTDMKQVLALFKGLDDDGLIVDIDAAREHLHGIGYDDSRIGVVGFCFGGRIAFLAGVRRALGAAVSFYGGGMTGPGFFRGFDPLVDQTGSLSTPWLGFFGDKDASIRTAEVETFRTVLAQTARVPNEIVRYIDADHAFHCDARPSYHEPSAKDAWQRTLDWFGTYLS